LLYKDNVICSIRYFYGELHPDECTKILSRFHIFCEEQTTAAELEKCSYIGSKLIIYMKQMKVEEDISKNGR
jgi:hypothetical protein